MELPGEDEEWICPPCSFLKAMKEKQARSKERQSTLDEHFMIPENTNVKVNRNMRYRRKNSLICFRNVVNATKIFKRLFYNLDQRKNRASRS